MLQWASSLDQIWQTPGLISLLTIGAAALFALTLIIVALRADRTLANGVLVLITLVATGTLAFATLRHGFAEPQDASPAAMRAASSSSSSSPSLAALACLDGLAGNGVESACERALFATPDAAAAAVSYTAAQLSRLAPSDAMGSRTQTVEGTALRRTLERDRFGLVAQVLTVREGCTPANCATFAIFSDPSRVIANMNERTYEATIGRYALSWPAGSTVAAAPAALPGGISGLPGLPPQNVAVAPAPLPAPAGMPTGRPTTIDFPSAASTPPVNIMIGEPPSNPIPPRAAAPAKQPPKEAPKKQAAKQNTKAAPVQLAPPAADAEEDN